MISKDLSSGEKDSIIRYMASNYQKAKRKEELHRMTRGLKEASQPYGNYQTLVYLVDSSIAALSKESKRIIETEYFSVRRDGWWNEYYTKSTFYRLKKEAIDEFVDCLNV